MNISDSTVINIVQVLESDIGIYRLYILYEEDEPLFASGTIMFEPRDSKDSKACLKSSVAINRIWLSKEGDLCAVDVMGNVYTCAQLAFQSAPNIASFASGEHHIEWSAGNICINALTHIAGTTNSDVWVAGTGGLVMHWNGRSWKDHSLSCSDDISSLTYQDGQLYLTTFNAIYYRQNDAWSEIDLSNVFGLDPLTFAPIGSILVPSGALIVCSRHGQIIEGTAQSGFTLLHNAETPWYGIASFQDSIYLAAGPAGVFSYKEGKLSCVKPKGHPVDLSASSDTLYCIPADQESGPWYFSFKPGCQSQWKQVTMTLR